MNGLTENWWQQELKEFSGLTSRQTKIIMCRINKKLYLPETSEEVGASISTIKRDTIIALKRISSYKRFCLQNTIN